MQWRTQNTLAAWLAMVLLVLASRHGLSHLGRHPRVNLEHVRQPPPRFVTDVNAADWPELTLLPRIGPALAQRIVESRKRDGPFHKLDDLLRVRGIGHKTLDGIQPYLVFGSPAPGAAAAR